MARYRRARQKAEERVDLQHFVDEDAEADGEERIVFVDLVPRYCTDVVGGTLFGLTVEMWDDVVDIRTPLHDELADDIEKTLKLAMTEDWSVIGVLATRDTSLPKGFDYVLPDSYRLLHEQPFCSANFIYNNFQKKHLLGLV